MTQSYLERRVDPRTNAFVQIRVRYHDCDDDTPAQLLDLSSGGAGLLTTSYNAPGIGDHLDINFEDGNTDGGSESEPRSEIGVVVNLGTPERGVTRIGIRFIQHPDLGCGPMDPIDLLNNHRRNRDTQKTPHRWETARNFDASNTPLTAAAW